MQPWNDWHRDPYRWGYYGPHTPYVPALGLATPGAVGNPWAPGNTPGDVEFANRVWLERERRKQAEAWRAQWGVNANAVANQTPGPFNFYAVPRHPAYGCSPDHEHGHQFPTPFIGTFTPGPGGNIGITTTPAPAPPNILHVTPGAQPHNALVPYTPASPPLLPPAPPPYTPWPMPGPLPVRKHLRKRHREKDGHTFDDFPGPPSLPKDFRTNWKQDTKSRTPCGRFKSWIDRHIAASNLKPNPLIAFISSRRSQYPISCDLRWETALSALARLPTLSHTLHRPLTASELYQSAILPSSSSHTAPVNAISLTHPSLPWLLGPIRSTEATGVTIYDLLYVLIEELNRPVTDIEFYSHWVTGDEREAVMATAMSRGDKTIRRIDFLLGETVFRGLELGFDSHSVGRELGPSIPVWRFFTTRP
ncbi:hypothetical protein PM082_006823 [Marasmius tenuissimus]|nr:hypothetical protein PM082_006823 [Marasmius tenuissimus]